MKSVLVYDGSFKGLLSAVYTVFENNLKNVSINRKGHTPDIFSKVVLVETKPEEALKVWRALKLKAGLQGADRIYKAFLSELKGAEDCILDYVITAYQLEQFNAEDNEMSCVKKINHAAAMVSRAADRHFEFAANSLSEQGRKWVSLSPDFNVLPILAKRLQASTKNEIWVLYDSKRAYGFRLKGNSLEPVYQPPFMELDSSAETDTRLVYPS